jgi:hypothetical protein
MRHSGAMETALAERTVDLAQVGSLSLHYVIDVIPEPLLYLRKGCYRFPTFPNEELDDIEKIPLIVEVQAYFRSICRLVNPLPSDLGSRGSQTEGRQLPSALCDYGPGKLESLALEVSGVSSHRLRLTFLFRLT